MKRAAFRDLTLLGAVALVAHGLLLLNDGIYWDDWLIYPQLVKGDWPSINALIHESGMTQVNSAFLTFFAIAPAGVFAFKLAVFLLIVAIGALAYLIALEAGFGRLESWMVAALTIVFPGFQDWVLLVTASEVLDLFLFLGATLLLLRAENVVGGARTFLRIAAIVCFVASFSLSSLLALYLGALLLLALVTLRSTTPAELVRRRWLYAAGLIALPLFYWVLSRFLYQPSGLYLGANSFVSKPSALARAIKAFITGGILDQLGQALGALLAPWTWPLLVVLIAGLALAWRGRRQPQELPGSVALGGLLVGLVALGLAILPYAAVGKYATAHGWDTRQDLLVSLPLAVVIVSGVRLVLAAGTAAWIGVGLVAVIGIGFAGAGVQDYAALQARWATDRAVMKQLAGVPGGGGYSVYWVHDDVPGPEDFYRFYEWSAMLGSTYGDETRIGLDTRGYDSTFLDKTSFFTDRYNLAGFDPHGCQADLIITPGASATDTMSTALTYTFDRLLQPDRLNAYLDGIARVQVVAHPSPDATDCTR